jgi:hypothetical protein
MWKSLSLALPICAFLIAPALAADPDWAAVAKALGKDGTVMQPGAVYRVALPRTDLNVTLDGVTLKPGFALGGWLAFEPAGDQAMMMGDLVFTQDEIAPVMLKLEKAGIDVTALHNHLLRASPATMYMHVMAMGDPVKLAAAVHDALGASKTPLAAPAAAAPAAPADLDIAALNAALGQSGKDNGGIVQYSIPRAENITDQSMPVPPAMGSAIAINFQPLGGGKAAITGDFALIGSEVEPALKALADNGIEVTALHSHMIDDAPHLYFMHFWGNDDAQKLAKGLRAALDKLNIAKT